MVRPTREIDTHLADTMIKKAGGPSRSFWLVFDMDGTLADLNGKEVLRPTLKLFFRRLMENNMTIYFGIYSNNPVEANVKYVAAKVAKMMKGYPLFHMCFKIHYFHESRKSASSDGAYEDKNYDIVKSAYEKCGHPVKNKKHVYFFDDIAEFSIRDTIGNDNYIHVKEYISTRASASASETATHKPRFTKTRRRVKKE
jgi:hypothetical protein